jgi:hypothetical protein
MEPLSIFVASSSKKEPIAEKIQTSLQEELAKLGEPAVVDLWRNRFPKSETAIESLETVAEEVDFAVLVMSGDDVTVRGKTKAVTPRDNLVFELGLFIGALGRDRSFIARDRKKTLRLPTDILGLTVLFYDSAPLDRLTTSLQDECAKLAAQMVRRKSRPKWLALGRAALAANGEFCRAVEGWWWERINYPGASALSLFTITPDAVPGGLMLEGRAFDKDGVRSALWKAEMVRLYPSERRIAYVWRGKHPQPGLAQLKFHGYGTMDFDPPDSASSICTKGTGDFGDVDEARPGQTVCKPLELRRVLDEGNLRLMDSGTVQEIGDLVRSVIEDW